MTLLQRTLRWIAGQFRPILRDLVLNAIASSVMLPKKLRPYFLSLFGHCIARTASIAPNCFLGSWSGLSVGASSYINYGCFFDLGAETVIGRNAFVGYEVMFCTCSHAIGSESQRAGAPTVQSIVVGDGAWVGARSILMPGSVVGPGTIVAAGSVVTGVCSANSLYAGVPARWVRDL